MAGKETVRAKLDRLRGRSSRGETVSVDASALLRFADGGIHFLLSAVLAGAAIFGDYAPFGVALVGAAGSGVCGAAALVGACFGYLTLLGFTGGLRYISASMLTFAVNFAFYDVKLLRKPWAMPMVAGLFNGVTGFIYLSEAGWRTEDVIYFFTECFLTVAASWCYRQLLLPLRTGRGEGILSPQRRVSLAALACTVLMSLSSLTLFEDVSLGRALAVVVVLAAAWQGGASAGAVLGVPVGLSLDLAANGVPLYAMAYGLSGLAAGAFRLKSRLRAALAYVLANGGAVLWTWDKGLPVSILYEVFLGSVAFLLLPERPLRRLAAWLLPEQKGALPADRRAQGRVQRRLEEAAQAFRTLYDTMRASFRPPQNDNDVATVFDRAACQVCRTCSLRSNCWERDYVSTFDALNNAAQPMLDRGRGEPGDFPQHFASRCIHFPDFLAAVNREVTALLYRRQYNSRIQDSRQAVCRQYGELSSLLGRAAAELGEELTPDPAAGRKLRQRLIKFTVLFLPDISRRLFLMRLFFTVFYLICQHPLPFLFICYTEALVDKDPDQPGLCISVVAQGMQLLERFHHRLLGCVRTVLVASQNGFRDPVKLPFILQDQIPEFFPVHTQSPLCCSVCFYLYIRPF